MGLEVRAARNARRVDVVRNREAKAGAALHAILGSHHGGWDVLWRCCCCCARTPAVERARLVILRRSHVRPRHWASRPPRHQNSEHTHFTCKLGRQICVLEACLPESSIILSHEETMAAAETLVLIPPPPPPVNLSAILSATRLHHADLC